MASLKVALTQFSPFTNKPQKYESLHTGDSHTSPPVPFPPSTRHKAYYFTAGLLAAFLISTLSFTATRIFTPSPPTAAEREAEAWNSCGRSSIIAQQRGCVMEPLFYGWMPPQCSWKELSDQYPVFEDRTWYADKNMTVRIPSADLWAGKHVHIYTERLVVPLVT